MLEENAKIGRYVQWGITEVHNLNIENEAEMKASVTTKGKKMHGMLHCATGPAIIIRGQSEYWLLGKEFEKDQFDEIVRLAAERSVDPSSQELCAIVGEVLQSEFAAATMLYVFQLSLPGTSCSLTFPSL